MSQKGMDAAQINGAGWRQGSALPPQLGGALRQAGLLPETSPDGEIWVILSHGCDVVNPSFDKEPAIEVICIAPLQGKCNGSLAWFRNPRVCHFEGGIGPLAGAWRVSIHERAFIPRSRLLGHRPDTDRAPHPETARRLVSWVARRYTRAAFPDEFGKRCSPARKALNQVLKVKGHLLTGIYFLVEDVELDPDRPYALTIIATMLEDEFERRGPRTEAQQLLDAIEVALDECDGIEVGQSSLRSEQDLRVGELRGLKRWDLDYLSLREDPVDDLPSGGQAE